MSLPSSAGLRFTYKNYRGEVSKRVVEPRRVWFGTTPWHLDPQWFMDAYDFEKESVRSFAMRDISGID
jgi:predicted DNA-binding transcriptional regulator YafY